MSAALRSLTLGRQPSQPDVSPSLHEKRAKNKAAALPNCLGQNHGYPPGHRSRLPGPWLGSWELVPGALVATLRASSIVSRGACVLALGILCTVHRVMRCTKPHIQDDVVLG